MPLNRCVSQLSFEELYAKVVELSGAGSASAMEAELDKPEMAEQVEQAMDILKGMALAALG